jgi:hypothetical protein
MPEEWRKSIVVHICKNKGNIQTCTNNRWIKPMSHTMILWERVTERRLRSVTNVTKINLVLCSGDWLQYLCTNHGLCWNWNFNMFVACTIKYRMPRQVSEWEVKLSHGWHGRNRWFSQRSRYIAVASGLVSGHIAVGTCRFRTSLFLVRAYTLKVNTAVHFQFSDKKKKLWPHLRTDCKIESKPS